MEGGTSFLFQVLIIEFCLGRFKRCITWLNPKWAGINGNFYESVMIGTAGLKLQSLYIPIWAYRAFITLCRGLVAHAPLGGEHSFFGQKRGSWNIMIWSIWLVMFSPISCNELFIAIISQINECSVLVCFYNSMRPSPTPQRSSHRHAVMTSLANTRNVFLVQAGLSVQPQCTSAMLCNVDPNRRRSSQLMYIIFAGLLPVNLSLVNPSGGIPWPRQLCAMMATSRGLHHLLRIVRGSNSQRTFGKFNG